MEIALIVLIRLIGLALTGCMVSFYFTPLQYVYRWFKIGKMCTFCVTFWISVLYNAYLVASWDVTLFTSLISAFISIELEKRMTKIKIDF